MLQTVDLTTGAGLDDSAAAQAAAEGVLGQEATIAALVRAALASETVRTAAARPHWRETYVAVPVEGMTLEGYVDLVYRDDAGLVVVDYKTDAVGDPADLARRWVTTGSRARRTPSPPATPSANPSSRACSCSSIRRGHARSGSTAPTSLPRSPRSENSSPRSAGARQHWPQRSSANPEPAYGCAMLVAIVKVVRFLVVFIVIVAVGGAALAGCFALLVPASAKFAETTSYGPLLPEMNKQAQRSYVLDSNGALMTTLFAEEDRQPITLADVPQHLIDAVLAIEDRHFYEHDGVDYEGTTRALFQNLDAGEIEQGGSTITQQLVKNTMGDPEKRDLKTKIREAVLAVRLENEMSKNEILERYLNVIYLGNGAYGVKAASERYFGKSVRSSSRSGSPRCSPG